MITYDQAIEALAQISMLTRHNPNGADEVACPSCCASTRIKGYAHYGDYRAYPELAHDSTCIIRRAIEQQSS